MLAEVVSLKLIKVVCRNEHAVPGAQHLRLVNSSLEVLVLNLLWRKEVYWWGVDLVFGLRFHSFCGLVVGWVQNLSAGVDLLPIEMRHHFDVHHAIYYAHQLLSPFVMRFFDHIRALHKLYPLQLRYLLIKLRECDIRHQRRQLQIALFLPAVFRRFSPPVLYRECPGVGLALLDIFLELCVCHLELMSFFETIAFLQEGFTDWVLKGSDLLLRPQKLPNMSHASSAIGTTFIFLGGAPIIIRRPRLR